MGFGLRTWDLELWVYHVEVRGLGLKGSGFLPRPILLFIPWLAAAERMISTMTRTAKGREPGDLGFGRFPILAGS